MVEYDRTQMKLFCAEFNRIQANSDVAVLPRNNRDCRFAYSKFSPIIQLLRAHGCQRGIDFGCGNCALLILGRIYNIDVKGIDVFEYRKTPNKYASLQRTMLASGYSVSLYNGGIFPKDIGNNFDFLTSYLSIDDDMTLQSKTNHLGHNHRSFYNRMLCILGVLRNKGVLCVGPRKKYAVMMNCIESHNDLSHLVKSKKIHIHLWAQNKIT